MANNDHIFKIPSEAADKNELLSHDVGGTWQPPNWAFATIKGNNWNKSFPYKFVILKKGSQNQWQKASDSEALLAAHTFPINPESLQISSPFSSTTQATLNGVVEEHNGIVFRTITIRGSTGVLPLKNAGSKENPGISGQALGGIFAGTIQSLNNTATLLKGVQVPNVIPEADFQQDSVFKGTGYYQWHMLEKWMEAYSEFKRRKGNENFAMGLEIAKDQAVWICTPIQFDLVRSAQSPLEYTYNIVLRAWRRVTVTVAPDHGSALPPARDPSAVASILNSIRSARALLEAGKNTLTAFRGDVQQTVFNPIKETILFCKDMVGVAESAADLPVNIVTDLREALLEYKAVDNLARETGVKFDKLSVRIAKAFASLSIEAGKLETDAGRPGSSSNALGNDPTKSGHPANKSNALENHTLLDAINPSALPLKGAIRKKIQDEKARVRALKREDFEKSRDSIQNFLDNFQASLGLLPDTVADIYGIPPQSKLREPTDSDYEIIYNLSQTVQQMDQLVASATINRNQVDTMDYFAGLANQAGIAFTVPQSKFLVPFPYGYTLEQLSLQYFGTPERWHEIAALNGLQSPYVDEVGFKLSLLVNGLGNTIMVDDVDKLFVNQQVWISSSITARTVRRISKISKLAESQYIVTLTGDADLGIYTTAAGAYLQAFLPNTVNSQQSLYIPSPETVDEEDFKRKAIPGIDQFDPLIRVGGIDLLLDSKNDLVFTPDGDCRLSVGLTNIIQKIRILVATPRGTLMDHPEYGFPIQPGQSHADLTADEILKICQDLFNDDPTFAGVESASVVKDGPVTIVTMYIALREVSQKIPVTINIVR